MNQVGIGIGFALVYAIIFTVIFGYAINKRGNWKNVWFIFVIIFLAAFAAGVWVIPIGPEVGGYYWLPGLVIAIIFAVLLAAVSPASRTVNESNERTASDKAKKREKADVQKELTAASYYSTKATPKGEDMNEAQEEKDVVVISSFIWIIMTILLALAIAGMFINV